MTYYQDDEREFLEAKATEWGFNDKCKLVFVERFVADNDDLKNDALSDVLQKNLLEGTKKDAVPAHILRDYLRQIFRKLEAVGCDFNGAIKDKRHIAQPWLRDIIYPEWLREYLWQQLKAKGTHTNQMGPVLVEPQPIPHLGLLHPEPILYRGTVPQGSKIEIHLNVDRKGYLILLEREPSGVVFCVCPSQYAPDWRHQGELTVLPQFPPSPHSSFAATEVGCEQLLAVITPELPPLEWLECSLVRALKLDKNHLNELLEYLKCTPNSHVFYTEYTVTH